MHNGYLFPPGLTRYGFTPGDILTMSRNWSTRSRCRNGIGAVHSSSVNPWCSATIYVAAQKKPLHSSGLREYNPIPLSGDCPFRIPSNVSDQWIEILGFVLDAVQDYFKHLLGFRDKLVIILKR